MVADQDLPPLKQLAEKHAVSVGTAQRAIALLKEWEFVEVARGRRTAVSALGTPVATDRFEVEATPPITSRAVGGDETLLSFEVRRLGEFVRTFTAEADPSEPTHLRRLLASAVRRDGRELSEILDYEMDVRRPSGELLTTFVAMSA